MRTVAWLLSVLVASACSAAHDGGDAALQDSGTAALDGAEVDDAAVDDTHVPTSPDGGTVVTTRCVPGAIPSGGFLADEVYVETGNAQCVSGACMVFHLVGNPECTRGDPSCDGPDPGPCYDATAARSLCVEVDVDGVSAAPDSPDRVFCTCRCGVSGNPSLPLCACPTGARCVADTEPGGGYCVPDVL